MKLSMHEDKGSIFEKHLIAGGVTTHVHQNYVTLRTYCTTLVYQLPKYGGLSSQKATNTKSMCETQADTHSIRIA